MDTVNLKTASTYLNNLLLARGLLRNGKQIQFARPHKAEGGTEQTLAEIINLVHDMILRRDREQEQRETLAQTIRTLRTESTSNITSIDRLQIKVDDLNRQLVQCQTQERAAARAAKTAEASARALRDELAKLKTTVGQIRAACANDVRKRDLQIQKLKSHLTTQQRGNRSAQGMAIVIQPGVTGVKSENSKSQDAMAVHDPAYSLNQETTEFLTQLSQSLSDENDNLISLVQSTLLTLKELQGLPENAERLQSVPDAITEEDSQMGNSINPPVISFDVLGKDMDMVLNNLRNILTNPNFVPIEEVAIREEEIHKLRTGWDHMELKWRETILMMDTWRDRVLNGDQTINLDEIKRVLGLGKEMNMQHGILEDSIVALTDTGDSDSEPSQLDDLDTSLVAPPSPSPAPKAERKYATARSPKKVAFQQHEAIPDSNSSSERTVSTRSSKSQLSTTALPPSARLPSASDVYLYISPSPRKRSSSPEPHPDERAPKLTVQEKLNVAAAEAEAAAVARGVLRAEDLSRPSSRETRPSSRENASRENTEAGARVKAEDSIAAKKVRKTGVKGRPRRRKSTLTPDELERLMLSAGEP
ncbi:hypothetical protein BT63DRAFT_443998 [Microthyrium microscopicum]|uniref:NIMA interactive protein n=1 Tax=Microthyrium microscopicum TaxID=703497 RepID=A0A6A6TVU3_9PEZI|nr:hypothetical protein BT63DRAFT_443998 [Microthyrium microscopicum]